MDSNQSIELRDSDADDVVLAIGRGYVLTLNVYEDSMRLCIEHEERNERYAENVSRDFFCSRQKRSTIANEVQRATTIDSRWLGDRFREIETMMTEQERALLADDAKNVLNRTKSVKAYQTADDLTVAVWIDAPSESQVDGSRRLEFDGAEFNGDSADALQQKHFNSFLTRIRIADGDWGVVRDEWLDEMDLEQSETQSADDRIADRVVDVLASKVANKVFDDKQALANSDETAYYESAEESEFNEPTVWIQSPAVHNAIDRNSDQSPTAYSGTLASTLRRHGIMHGSSSRRRVPNGRATLWPFSAEALRVDELVVQQYGSGTSGEGGDDIDIEQ